MVKRLTTLASAVFVVAIVAIAVPCITAQTKQYVTSADTVKFSALDPSNPGGIQVAVVSGDMQNGPVTFFMKLPKGPSPLHTHTAGYYGIVVKGQAKHWPAGGEAKAPVLNPGSHWYQPGKAAHGDECLAAECVLLLQMEGGFDFAMAK